MPATPDDLFAYSRPARHRASDRDARRRCSRSSSRRRCAGRFPGGHTKNLFLKDKKGALFLVTALEDAVIELKSLHRLLGACGRFSFGSAELMRETLGIEPGAVTPLAAMNDTERRVTVVLDAALMRHAIINCHPLVNTMTTSIAPRRSGQVPGGDRPPAPDHGGGGGGGRARDIDRAHCKHPR